MNGRTRIIISDYPWNRSENEHRLAKSIVRWPLAEGRFRLILARFCLYVCVVVHVGGWEKYDYKSQGVGHIVACVATIYDSKLIGYMTTRGWSSKHKEALLYPRKYVLVMAKSNELWRESIFPSRKLMPKEKSMIRDVILIYIATTLRLDYKR